MLVNMKDILVKAREGHYGVIAPTIRSADEIKHAIEAAEHKNSPVILNFNITYDFVCEDADLELVMQVARERAMRSSVPVALNVDHGKDFATCMRGIHYGFESVMIDASARPYEENVAITKQVVEAAHAIGISVEAELGCVGMGDPNFKIDGKYSHTTETNPDDVADFIEKTGVDCLAVSIGNAHGPYAKDIIPHINFELLDKIAATTPIPLVLHGGSGTGDENMAKACTRGICKINVSTDIAKAGSELAVEKLNENPKKGRLDFHTNFHQGYREKIEYYMDVFGSTDKA